MLSNPLPTWKDVSQQRCRMVLQHLDIPFIWQALFFFSAWRCIKVFFFAFRDDHDFCFPSRWSESGCDGTLATKMVRGGWNYDPREIMFVFFPNGMPISASISHTYRNTTEPVLYYSSNVTIFDFSRIIHQFNLNNGNGYIEWLFSCKKINKLASYCGPNKCESLGAGVKTIILMVKSHQIISWKSTT